MQFPPLHFARLNGHSAHNAGFPSILGRKALMRIAACVALASGAALSLAPTSALALSPLTCGPEHSTISEVRDSIPTSGPNLIDLTAAETDRYLDQLGHGRPDNSQGKGSVIVVVPNKGVLLGMTEGPNMCAPYLRVTHGDHQRAMDAALGMAI